VANALKTLERKGFVTREINPADRRGIIVSITTEGKEFGTARFNEAITSMRDLVDDLGEEDTKELVRILERIQDRIIERTGIEPPPLG
jgi:DNA-binding MarR family transcriptional regulator